MDPYEPDSGLEWYPNFHLVSNHIFYCFRSVQFITFHNFLNFLTFLCSFSVLFSVTGGDRMFRVSRKQF